jgi:hypothetical protein
MISLIVEFMIYDVPAVGHGGKTQPVGMRLGRISVPSRPTVAAHGLGSGASPLVGVVTLDRYKAHRIRKVQGYGKGLLERRHGFMESMINLATPFPLQRLQREIKFCKCEGRF